VNGCHCQQRDAGESSRSSRRIFGDGVCGAAVALLWRTGGDVLRWRCDASRGAMSKPIEARFAEAGVVVNDLKKWCKMNSPAVQAWELSAAHSFLPSIKMGEQALKKAKTDEKPLRSWIRSEERQCWSLLGKHAAALRAAMQATDEDPSLAYAWSTLGNIQVTAISHVVCRADEAIENCEKAIAIGLHPKFETASRDGIKLAQKTAAKQAAAAQPAGGGAAAQGAGEAADPGVYSIDTKWQEDAQYMRFEELVNQEQWAKALKIGEFVLEELPGASGGCARTSAASSCSATSGCSSTSRRHRKGCRRRRRRTPPAGRLGASLATHART